MRVPTRQRAEAYLADAERANPGPWAAHSRHTARAAEAIARAHPSLDPDAAAVLGLLHDIGRGRGVSDFRHVLDGYRLLAADGFDGAARICLTHSFPRPDLNGYAGEFDAPEEDVRFVAAFLADRPFDDYDRLIQLCDGLCLPTGFCLMEKRLVDVALRHGYTPAALETWRERFAIKARIEQAIGGSIYRLLDGVVANTFA
ncbi:MAG: HD domain-containing protein [Planctomycetes bacterium]|nr:HD domain-containing protein [Planctomycetota bacterium]